MQDLGTLGGDESFAWGVSADGSVIVGWAHDASGYQRAFRWTQDIGMRDLGTLGGNESQAIGASADGSIVVGWAHDASGYQRAFRWTQDIGMRDLGTLGGDSWAMRSSADGSVIVGWAKNASGTQRAFRWTATEGMQVIVTLGEGSAAFAMSPDGSVVGGGVFVSGVPHAFRWTPSGGTEDLNQTNANLLTNGSILFVTIDISPDGRYIVGQGYNAATGRTEAFLLDTQGTSSAGEDGATGLELTIVPQPVVGSGYVHVRARGSARVEVCDLLGRTLAVLAEGVLPAGSERLRLPELPAGMYVVRARSGQQWITAPVVVVR